MIEVGSGAFFFAMAMQAYPLNGMHSLFVQR